MLAFPGRRPADGFILGAITSKEIVRFPGVSQSFFELEISGRVV
jgi:hypothetical protein